MPLAVGASLRQVESDTAIPPQPAAQGYYALRRLVCLPLLLILAGCWNTQSRPPVTHPPIPANPTPVGLALDVQVVDVDGPPLPEAVVTILDGPNKDKTAAANSLGRALLTDLRVAGQTVCAAAEGYQRACEGVTLLTSSNVTIRLHKVGPPPPSVSPTPRLKAQGRNLVEAATGKVVELRPVMAFALLDVLVDNEPGALAYLQWAQKTGFNAVRVLAANHGWMTLSVADGRAHLPRLFTLAAEHGLYVQIVSVAGGKVLFPTRDAVRSQVKAIGAIAAQYSNSILEIANEPYHSSQPDFLYSPSFMKELRGLVSASVPTMAGAPEKDEPLTDVAVIEGRKNDGAFLADGFDIAAVHRKRQSYVDRWENVRRLRETYAVADVTGKVTFDNEPTGAAEVNDGSSRYTDDAYFFAQGALARLFGVVSNFHCTDCLNAKVPGPVQRKAAEAFIAGTRVIPDGVRLTYRNTGHESQGSPASGADFTKVTRVYFGLGSPSIGIAVGLKPGVTNPGIEWANGYRIVETLGERRSSNGEGVVVWRVSK